MEKKKSLVIHIGSGGVSLKANYFFCLFCKIGIGRQARVAVLPIISLLMGTVSVLWLILLASGPQACCPLLSGAQGHLLALQELLWWEPAAEASLPAWGCPSASDWLCALLSWAWAHPSLGAAFLAGLGPAAVPGDGWAVAEPSHCPHPGWPHWGCGIWLLRKGGHCVLWSSPAHDLPWEVAFWSPFGKRLNGKTQKGKNLNFYMPFFLKSLQQDGKLHPQIKGVVKVLA